MSWSEESGTVVVRAYGREETVSLPATLGDVVDPRIRSGADDVFLNGTLVRSGDADTELLDGDVVEIRAAVVAKNGSD